MKTTTKRPATVYMDSDLHRALRLKAAEVDRSISDLVNDAVRRAVGEDAEDLAAFEETVKERSYPFEEVAKRLKARGKL